MCSAPRTRYTKNYIWVDPTDDLGKGATGAVFKCRHQETGEVSAVKCFKDHKMMQREYDVLREVNKVSHPNIMNIVAAERELSCERQAFVIIMDYCAGGSLLKVLEAPENNCGLTDDELILFIFDIVSALEYLRQNKIVHRDIKPGNILKYFAKDGQTFYRLTDFGSARKAEDDQPLTSIHGTDEYLHPAMYDKIYKFGDASREFQYNADSDLWSLGVTIFHMATGFLPFRAYHGRKDRMTMHKIVSEKPRGVISGVQDKPDGKIHYEKTLPASCRLSAAFRSYLTPFIARLLEKDGARLWTFEDLFKWVSSLRQAHFLELFVLSACTFDRVYVPATIDGQSTVDYVNLVRNYVQEKYAIQKDKCDLLLPFGTQAARLPCFATNNLVNTDTTSTNLESCCRLPLATSDDFLNILQSCLTVRLRVALAERTNRRDVTHFAAQLDALKLVPASQQHSGSGLTPKGCAIAMRRIATGQMNEENAAKYIEECLSQLKEPDTLRASLEAQIQSFHSGITLANRLAGTGLLEDFTGCYEAAARAGFAYTMYRASISLADAQALIAASSNHLVVGLKRGMHVVCEMASSFYSACDQTLAALTTVLGFVDSQLGMLEVLNWLKIDLCASENASVWTNRIAKLRNLKSDIPELENDVKLCRNQVQKYVSMYYETIVVRDEASRKWQERLGDSHCFGRVCSFGRFARLLSMREAGQSCNTSRLDSTNDSRDNPIKSSNLPCWKILQRNYEECSAVHEEINSRFKALQSGEQQSLVVEIEKKHLQSLNESCVSQVLDHCWVRTIECYSQFIRWWKQPSIVMENIEKLRLLIQSRRQSLRLMNDRVDQMYADLQSLEGFCNFNEYHSEVLMTAAMTAASNTSVVAGTSNMEIGSLELQMTERSAQTEAVVDVKLAQELFSRLDALIADAEDQYELINSEVAAAQHEETVDLETAES